MGKLNMKEWISQTIQRKETIAIPIMTHPGIEFIGKTVHDALFDCLVFAELDVVIIKYISFCFKFYFSENTDTKNPATSLESSKYRTHSS